MEKKPTSVLLDVNGVGYLISIPLSTFYDLPEEKDALTLFIHTYVREDILALYGFRTKREQHLFEKLLGVSGIGPKAAIAFLSGMSAEELIPAIQRQDIVRLTTIPGVGRKTAERVCLELRESIPALLTEAEEGPAEVPIREDLVSALVNLGYHRSQVERTVKAVLEKAESDTSFETLLRHSLQMITS